MAHDYHFTTPKNPALPPPPGVIPDFQDPFSLRPYHTETASLCILTTSIFVFARLYTKWYIIKAYKWEDYTCLLGWLCFMVYIGLQFRVTGAGMGTHQWNVTWEDMAVEFRFTNYLDTLYSPSLLFTKLSILLLILRIFCPSRDGFYWTIQSLNAVNTIFYALFMFINIFLCSPRRKIYDPFSPGRCLKIFELYITSATFNVVSDIAMFFVPLWRIWHLQISRKRKVGISAIFFTGALAVLSSVFRLIFCTFLLKNVDYSYVKMQSVLWSYSEISFAIICSCFPILPRLYQHLAAIPPYGVEGYESGKYKDSIKLVQQKDGRRSDTTKSSKETSIPKNLQGAWFKNKQEGFLSQSSSGDDNFDRDPSKLINLSKGGKTRDVEKGLEEAETKDGF